MKEKKLNYMSLFSSAGIGCFGFKNNGFENVLTAELLEERINIQKLNKVSSDGGYIQGDLSTPEIKEKINKRISLFNADVDVIVATPPCQSVSTLNKKNAGDITRNSLITQSIEIVKNVRPKYFIFENVRSFLKALCIDSNGQIKTTKEAIIANLENDYLIRMDVINFNEYGTNSSRPRTLVIGTRKDLKNTSPNHIWPEKKSGMTLKESIGNFEELNDMGDFSESDPWHFYREYDKRMIPWIEGLKQGESAFDNKDPLKIPHKLVKGEIVYNANKMTNKYKRMYWDNIPPCVHTRSDVLAAQYTIHPEQNRVLSISELKQLLNIPRNFRFTDLSDEEILSIGDNQDIRSYTKKHELNIRRVIGEAVPYNIFESIANNIKHSEQIEKEFETINCFDSEDEISSFEAKSRFYEISNANRESEGAYYTPQSVVFDIINSIGDFKFDRKINVLEPSVGTGNFIPQLVKVYGEEKIKLYVFDSNEKSISKLKEIISKFYPRLEIEYYNQDFVQSDFEEEVDIIIGNPPYITIKNELKKKYIKKLSIHEDSNNLITFFYLKALNLTKRIYFVLPKYFLYSTEYKNIRTEMNGKISKIYDYGIDYFDVFVETISILMESRNINKIEIKNRKFTNLSKEIESSKLMWNGIFIPYVNEDFIRLYNQTKERSFEMYRDRQITNKFLSEDKSKTRVIKSRNLGLEGNLIDIEGYDRYIEEPENFIIYEKTFEAENAYIIPNFTYKFRIMQKPKNAITNGSVIVIIYDEIPNLELMNSEKYKEYFLIIMSHSKFTLNINKDIIKLLRW